MSLMSPIPDVCGVRLPFPLTHDGKFQSSDPIDDVIGTTYCILTPDHRRPMHRDLNGIEWSVDDHINPDTADLIFKIYQIARELSTTTAIGFKDALEALMRLSGFVPKHEQMPPETEVLFIDSNGKCRLMSGERIQAGKAYVAAADPDERQCP